MKLAEAYVSLMVRRRRKRARLVARELTLDSGERYAYLEGGSGTPLVLLHGFGGSKDNFAPLAAHLTRSHRVIAVDHLGFGDSSRIDGADYTPVAQAHRLHRVLTALGLDHIHLGGNSMGSQIALTYAALYPANVRSLWLMNSGGVWSAPRSDMHEHFLATGENLMMSGDEDSFGRTVAMMMHKPPRVPKAIRRYLVQRATADAALHLQIFRQVAADSVEARVSGLTVPTLITWGANDRVISAGAAAVLKGLIPNAHVDLLPEVGHLPMIEAPELCAAAYFAFRASLGAEAADSRLPDEEIAA